MKNLPQSPKMDLLLEQKCQEVEVEGELQVAAVEPLKTLHQAPRTLLHFTQQVLVEQQARHPEPWEAFLRGVLWIR